MVGELQIIDWNIKFTGYIKKKLEFLFSVAEKDYFIILQEVTREDYSYIEKIYGENCNFVYSLDCRKSGMFDSSSRKLGTLIVCGKNIKVIEYGIVERALLPERTVWAVTEYEGRQIKILGVHSLARSGFGKAKSLQYEAISEFLYEFRPDIIGVDANEPETDSYDIDKMRFYDDNEGSYGTACFFRTVKNIGLKDAYVSANKIAECDNGCLAVSYNVCGTGDVRFDFLFVNNKFTALCCKYLYKEALEAGSDHALITACFNV